MADLVLVKPKGASLIPDARPAQKGRMSAEAAQFTHVSLYVGNLHCLEISGYSLWPGAASRIVPMPLDSPRQEVCILRRTLDAHYNEMSRLQIVFNAYSTHAIKRPRYAYFRAGLYYVLSKIPGLKFVFDDDDDTSVICSKFIFNALNDAGFLREEDMHARRNEPLPGDFYDWPEFERRRLTYWKLED